jgi:hypothetical protein
LEEAFELLSKKEMSYVIVKELHEDGTPHMHIYLQFPSQRQIYSRDKLHVKLIGIDGEVVVQEGKYEAVRNGELVIAYILKSAGENYLSNMNVPMLDGIVYTDPEEHLHAILESRGYEAATNALITKYKKLAAKKAATIVRNLRTVNTIILQKKSKESNSIKDIENFKIPERVLH